ncbi:MAG: conjugal transfer protein TraI [Ferruginibacter sp.]
MKKQISIAGMILLLSLATVEKSQAQIPVLEIIKAGVKKVILAIDLKIQRLQNQTIWLQNAQKTLENEMSKLKLKEIGDWADKQKKLYAEYFEELSKVKSAISTYHTVREIISKQGQLVTECSRAFNLSKQDQNFTPQEIEYMGQVYSGILEESLKDIEQVQMVITAFAIQMTDEKRLLIISNASDNLDRNLGDLRQFNQQNIRISLQRSKERNDINVVKKLYGLE